MGAVSILGVDFGTKTGGSPLLDTLGITSIFKKNRETFIFKGSRFFFGVKKINVFFDSRKKIGYYEGSYTQHNTDFFSSPIKGTGCFYMIQQSNLDHKEKCGLAYNVTLPETTAVNTYDDLYTQKNAENISLSGVSDRDKIWDNHRFQAELIENIYRMDVDLIKYAERIGGCSGFLEFGWNINGLQLKRAMFCRVRYCPVCQWRRSLLWKAMMYQALDKLLPEYPKHRYLFLTLTVQNCHINDLRNTLRNMNKAWKKLIERDDFNVVDGYVRTTEITRDTQRPNTHAHPHFHCLLMVKPSYFGKNYKKKDAWAKLWQDVMGVDYEPVVDIRVVKANKKKGTDTIQSAIAETLKYSVKPSDVFQGIDDPNPSNAIQAAKWFHELTKQTHRLRFVATGGLLKNALKPADKITNDDLILTGDQPTDERRLSFTYRPTQHRYMYTPKFNK